MTAWDLYWITLGALALAIGVLVYVVRRVYLWTITGRWARRRRARARVLAAVLEAGGKRLGEMMRRLHAG